MGIPEIGPLPLGEFVTPEGKVTGFICGPGGCCPGCWRCVGFSVCHQYPCRCEHACTCGRDEDGDRVAGACVRHDDAEDQRGDMPPSAFSGMRCPVCDPKKDFISDPDCNVCGGVGAIPMVAIDYITRCLETTPRAKHQGYPHSICANRATSYIWPKDAPRRWRPVCGVHIKKYLQRDNIMELDRL